MLAASTIVRLLRPVEIHRTALVLHTAPEMFRLVADVERYPEFLSWCRAARLLERTESMQMASLEIALAGISQTFTTRNRLDPPETLAMSLVEGPFRRLSGEWRFQPLGEQGCKIGLMLSFEFANALLSAAFRRSFSGVADRLVTDFCKRAETIYGQRPGAVADEA